MFVFPHGLKASDTTRSKRFQSYFNTTTQRRTKKIVIYRIRCTLLHREFPGSGTPTFTALHFTNLTTRFSFVNISHTCPTCIRIISDDPPPSSNQLNLFSINIPFDFFRSMSRFSQFFVGNTLFDVFVLREPRYRSAMFGLVKAN